MSKLSYLFILVFFNMCFIAQLCKANYPPEEVKQIVEKTISSGKFGLYDYEKDILRNFTMVFGQANNIKSKITETVKNVTYKAGHKIKSVGKKALTFIKSIPVSRVTQDVTKISAPALNGCISGIISGLPLEISLAAETYGLGSAVVGIGTCLTGAILAGTPSFTKVTLHGFKDIYKAKKIKQEIEINEQDLRVLKSELIDAEYLNITNFNQVDKAKHFDNILELSRKISAIELYIVELNRSLASLK